MSINKISRIDRFAAVKLRQRIQEEILKAPNATHTSLFSKFMLKRWLPNKANGEPLEDFGFRRHFNTVKKGFASQLFRLLYLLPEPRSGRCLPRLSQARNSAQSIQRNARNREHDRTSRRYGK